MTTCLGCGRTLISEEGSSGASYLYCPTHGIIDQVGPFTEEDFEKVRTWDPEKFARDLEAAPVDLDAVNPQRSTWSDAATSDPIADLRAWVDIYRETAGVGEPDVLILSPEVAHEYDWQLRKHRWADRFDWEALLFPRWAKVNKWVRRQRRNLHWWMQERNE